MSLAKQPAILQSSEPSMKKENLLSQSSSNSDANTQNSNSVEIKSDTEFKHEFKHDNDESNTSMDSSDLSQDSISSRSNSSSTSKAKEFPRKRRRTSPNELYVLEAEFRRNNKPDRMEREKIAAMTSMDEKAVQVWFQNKRQSCRRNQHSNPSVFGACLAVRTQSAPIFQDENNIPMMTNFGLNQQLGQANALFPPPMTTANTNLAMNMNTPNEKQAKKSKSLRLSMSADGKAEIVERSPLKQLNSNHQNYLPAGKLATLPMNFPRMNGIETDCANSLLCLKSGQWN